MDLSDIGRIAWPLEPALAPDGTQLAFVLSKLDLKSDRLAYDVMVGATDGSDFAPLDVDGRTRHPAWSTSGAHLAFMQETAGRWQLATTRSGLTFDPNGPMVAFDWMSTDRSLVVLAETESGQRLSVVELDGMTELTRIDLEGQAASVVAASPTTGQVVVATSPAGDDPTGIWLWDPVGGDMDLLWAWKGPVHGLRWSPAGSQIAALVNRMGPGLWANNELWVLDVDGNSRQQLGTSLDISFGQAIRGDDERGLTPVRVEWPPDGAAIYSVFSEKGTSRLGVFGLDGSHQVVAADRGSIVDFTIAAESGDIVISWTSTLSPGELSSLINGSQVQVTSINSDWLDEVELAPTQKLELEDGPEGWLTAALSDDGCRERLVVQVHGGPHYPVGNRFSFDSQRFASYGLATLRSNPRGSQGYGEGYAAAIVGDWGGVDYQDLLAITNAAISSGLVASDRVAIVGESYGGYLASWAVTQSDRFDVAVVENGVSDLRSIAHGPRGESFWRPVMGGSPADHPQRYEERSPITGVESVGASILLINAEEDDNVTPDQTLRFAEALSEAGVDVSLHTVPGEGHMINVFGSASSRLDRTERLDGFLRDHLCGKGEVEK